MCHIPSGLGGAVSTVLVWLHSVNRQGQDKKVDMGMGENG